MKVLVIGGMGIIGSAITEAAAKKKMEVYVLSRRSLISRYKNIGIQGYSGDWKNNEFAEQVLQNNYDIIVDTLVFNINELKRDLQLVEGHCKQFIYISTDAVYNHPQLNVSEDVPIDLSRLEWPYGYNKREAELYLLEHENEYSFFWTVIRPTVTYGDTRIPVGFASRKNEYTLIKRIINGKPVVAFDDTDSVHSICHSSTFGSVVTDTFLNDNAKFQFIHISNDKTYKYQDIFDAISKLLEREVKIIHIDPIKLKSLNKGKYEEIIYDKNPSFTLNNKRAKEVSRNTNFDVDIIESLRSTLQNLEKEDKEEDIEYNMLSDALISEYTNLELPENEKAYAQDYYRQLSNQEKD